MNRRDFLTSSALAFASTAVTSGPVCAVDPPRFATRGVVLYPFDLSLADWPQRAAKAGLTTIGLHAARRFDVLADFIRSERGQKFLGDCRNLEVHVEFELHAMGELLSRELFYHDDSLFRVDPAGHRNADANCCPSSSRALEIIAEKTVAWAAVFRPTTSRYFYWPDDGRDWCNCSRCRELSPSDQALIVENSIVTALRKHLDPQAQVCHISYHQTLAPPRKIKPAPGIFVEFAPIRRVYDRSIADRAVKLPAGGPDPDTHGGYLDILSTNLDIFGRETAQVLEYWLDVSRFSGWRRPSKIIPWNPDVVRADLSAYAQLGVRHVTTFATWVDADYVQRLGEPPLSDYGSLLQGK